MKHFRNRKTTAYEPYNDGSKDSIWLILNYNLSKQGLTSFKISIGLNVVVISR